MADATSPSEDFALLIKLLKLTTSSNDAEALLAIRKANAQLHKLGWEWAPRYFIYREHPFRPLYHRFWFAEPRVLREVHRGVAHIWWFLDKALVQRMTKQMSANEPTLFAEERDYVRISGGYSPKPAEGRGPKPSTRAQARNERIDDL